MKTVDYKFYAEKYHGVDISKIDFDRLIIRAAAYINSIKRRELPDDENVGMALCAVAEAWHQNEQGGEITSQSVGSWSQSYASSNKSDSQRLFDAANLYIPDYISSVRWV